MLEFLSGVLKTVRTREEPPDRAKTNQFGSELKNLEMEGQCCWETHNDSRQL